MKCGILAGPLFVLTFTARGRRRDGYPGRRDPASLLAVGRLGLGWVSAVSLRATHESVGDAFLPSSQQTEHAIARGG